MLTVSLTNRIQLVLPIRKDYRCYLPRAWVCFLSNRVFSLLTLALSSALVGVTDTSGKSIFEGRTVTGFSNAEEEQAGKVKDVPFLVESRIKELGGTYIKAEEAWGVSTQTIERKSRD
jgi:hypothetical protein